MQTSPSAARALEVFCDFDGTITKRDVVDSFLEAFASLEWLEIEALWKEGRIGSRECLERQIACVPPLGEAEMEGFLAGIELDPHFLEFARAAGPARLTIVSDGFDLFIDAVMSRHGLEGYRRVANRLVWSPGRAPRAEFPHHRPPCASGVCKCAAVQDATPRPFAYIGDGRSDFCVSGRASVVLSKGALSRYCAENGIKAVEYRTFQEVLRHFEALDREPQNVR